MTSREDGPREDGPREFGHRGAAPLRPIDSRPQPPTRTDPQARNVRLDEEWADQQIETLANWHPPDEPTPAAPQEAPNGPLPRSPYDLSNPEPGRHRPFSRRVNEL